MTAWPHRPVTAADMRTPPGELDDATLVRTYGAACGAPPSTENIATFSALETELHRRLNHSAVAQALLAEAAHDLFDPYFGLVSQESMVAYVERVKRHLGEGADAALDTNARARLENQRLRARLTAAIKKLDEALNLLREEP